TLPADRYEVIVTDDGAPTSEQLVAERYAWVSWGPGPRRGPAANRNAGARRSGQEWIAFTDDDCVPDPGWLAAFAAAVHHRCGGPRRMRRLRGETDLRGRDSVSARGRSGEYHRRIPLVV